jgi:hypothetical protein
MMKKRVLSHFAILSHSFYPIYSLREITLSGLIMPARRRRHNSSPEITDGFTDSTPDFIDNDSDDTSSSDSDGSGTNSSSSYTLIDPDTDHMVVIPNDLHDSGNGDLSDSFLSEPRTRIVQFVERLFGVCDIHFAELRNN